MRTHRWQESIVGRRREIICRCTANDGVFQIFRDEFVFRVFENRGLKKKNCNFSRTCGWDVRFQRGSIETFNSFKSVPQLFCVYRWCLIGRFPIKKRVKFSVIWLKRMKGEWIFIYSSNFWKERSFLLSS